MKYELETIPVWEAFRQDSECPVCILEKKAENQFKNFFLGDSVMDPDTRVAVNEAGFCPTHSELLFEGGHKLGVAFMTHTFLLEYATEFGKLISRYKDATKNKRVPQELFLLLAKPATSCLFCHRLGQTVDRYVFTILYLYKKDPDFKSALFSSKGFCVKHLARALAMAEEELKGSVQEEFITTVLELEQKRFSTLAEELDWFTQKFDYRNQDKPWGNSKDALSRTLQKLKGHRFLDKAQDRFM